MFLTLAVPHPQEIIPEERRNAVLSKYFEETLLLADSLGHADYNVLDQHHTETGSCFPLFQSLESISDSMERLHTTSQLVFTALLQYRIPIPSSSIPLYRSALFAGIREVTQTGGANTLILVMEIANSIPWETLNFSSTEAMQFSSLVRKLLSETGPKDTPVTKSHLDNMLTMWMTLSLKWVVLQHGDVDILRSTRKRSWMPTRRCC